MDTCYKDELEDGDECECNSCLVERMHPIGCRCEDCLDDLGDYLYHAQVDWEGENR